MENKIKTCKYCGVHSSYDSHGDNCREKEFKPLNEKMWDVTISGYRGTKYHKGFLKEDVKQKIQNAQRRLYEKFPLFEAKVDPLTIHNEVDQIFKEEFGDKLLNKTPKEK